MSELNELEQSKLAKRIQLAQWRASQRHELTLPSGLAVIVKDASITDLAFSGKIPETLMAQIMETAEKSGGQMDLKAFSAFGDFGKLLDELVKACLVEPPIAEKADDEHITLAELSYTDRMEIFNWANREVAGLADSFRAGQTEPVPAAQPG